jgi:diguanylate cyclase
MQARVSASADFMGQMSVRQDPAIALAHDAIASMRDLRISPTPENFRLWYMYHSGSSQALREELDARVAEGRPLGPDDLAALHARHCLEEPQAVALDMVARQIEASLEEGLALLTGAGADAERYGAALADAGQAIAAGSPALAEVLGRLLADTQELCRRSHAVAERLRERADESHQLRLALEEARRAAQTDALTGLPNRRGFDDSMANLLQGEGPLSLAVLDIDHFKAVNDTYGHAAGDVVLRGVARVLRAGLAAGEWPARVGGEEFAVVLPGAGQEEARTRGEALRRAVAGIDFLAGAEGARFSVTVSLGVAEHRRGEAAEALIARADTALYTAKRRGRDRVVIARDGDD